MTDLHSHSSPSGIPLGGGCDPALALGVQFAPTSGVLAGATA